MHPVLLEIPLPSWSVPLAPALALVAAVGAAVAFVGWRAKATDLLAIGVTIALGATVGAVALRGQAYTLSAIPLSSYGVTVCLALVVAWYLTLGLAKRDGLPREITANCFIVAAISGLVAARLLYAAANWEQFVGWRDVVDIRRGGLSAYGAMLGGALGAVVYLRVRGLPLLPWGDVAMPALALGVALGRVGTYLLGSGYGKPLGEGAPDFLRRLGTFPRWGDDVLQGAGSPAWVQHVSDGLLSIDSATSLPVHPTQLYAALGGFGLLGILFAVRQRQTFRGQLVLTFGFGYGCLCFVLDWLRDDPQRGLLGPHVAEHRLLSLGLLMLAAAFVFGPARSIHDARWRRAAQATSALPGVVGYLALRPEPFALADPVQLSVSQWIALLTGIAGAVTWGVLAKAAEANPEAAMRLELDLPEPEEAGEQAEPDDDSPDPDEAGESGQPEQPQEPGEGGRDEEQ
jgi:phosphatidylglycerol:prolipoprotein diacylglycerol transferase